MLWQWMYNFCTKIAKTKNLDMGTLPLGYLKIMKFGRRLCDTSKRVSKGNWGILTFFCLEWDGEVCRKSWNSNRFLTISNFSLNKFILKKKCRPEPSRREFYWNLFIFLWLINIALFIKCRRKMKSLIH